MRRRGPRRLALRESARVIKTSLRPAELGLIRRSLARGAPSDSRSQLPCRLQLSLSLLFFFFFLHRTRSGDTFISEKALKTLALRGWNDISMPPSQQESISVQPASHPSCQLELHSQFGNVRMRSSNSSSARTDICLNLQQLPRLSVGVLEMTKHFNLSRVLMSHGDFFHYLGWKMLKQRFNYSLFKNERTVTDF